MSTLPLTAGVMLEQLRRMHDVWPKWDVKEEDFLRMAHGYRDALNDVDAEAVTGAVSLYLRTAKGPRWAPPAELRELAIQWMKVNRDFTPRALTADVHGCKVCGAEAAWAVLAVTDYSTQEVATIERMIQPCELRRHPAGSPYVPFPQNFVRWAPPPDPDGTYPQADGPHPVPKP